MNEQSQMVKNVSLVFDMESFDIRLEEFQIKLRERVAELLQKDFARLINILYRLDVNEEKLKSEIYNQHASDAAELISKLIIERQLEKLQTRWQQRSNENIPDADKW